MACTEVSISRMVVFAKWEGRRAQGQGGKGTGNAASTRGRLLLQPLGQRLAADE